MSETNTLHAALLAFQKKGIKINKDATNPHFKSKYASLTNIIEKITPALNELGLTVVHSLSGDKVITTISDGSSDIASEFPIFGNKAQEFGSSISYARRYNLSALLNLDIDDDDDGNTAHESKPIFADKNLEALKLAVSDGKFTTAEYAIQKAKENYTVTKTNEIQIRNLF